ncbi:MAG TPA: LuxR C-terminal-related transcriptional regulator [Spirochaetia bacterium]|nr:LuxR C-terminal-related transcriptional regulator [Spirochaetia bacterium]
MPATILPTKIAIPPPRKNRVSRTLLAEALSAGVHRKLTLISAPAGFGKSTLVADWLTGWPGRAAWISLDEGDGDISSFLAYLIAALDPITGNADTLMDMAHSPQSSPELTLASLIGDLTSVHEDFIVVLDDYQRVDSDAVDNALQYLVDYLPQTMHLVLTTREDPQLSLSRLRAKDELTEIRAADLRFDIDEARRFLNQVMGLDLSPRAIETLEERTEGWVAGLQLAALSMQHAADRERFVEDFSGSHRYLMDYLAEDVLEKLPGDVRAFLGQTSILERFSASLCDAVTGRTDSAAVIDYLDRANLFVMPLDVERGWYRYHHLFRDLLRSHIRDADAASADLHLRASGWFERNGFPLEAFSHAVAAADTDRAAAVLEGDGMPIHYRGTFAPVERWLTSLTEEELDQRPELRIACAWVLTTRGAPLGDIDALLDPAQIAVRALQPGRRADDFRGQIAAIRSLLAIPRGELESIIGNAQSALELLDPRNRPVRTTLAWSLGYAHQLLGELEPARLAFTQAVREGHASGNLVITIGATISLGQIDEAESRLSKATQTYHEALRLAGEPPLPYACEAYLGLARVQYAQNHLGQARENALRAREIGRRLDNVNTPGMAALLEARIELAHGNRDAALAALESARSILRDRGIEHHAGDLGDVTVQIHIDGGKLSAAMEVAREHGLTDRIAQLYVLEGEPLRALETLGSYVRADDGASLLPDLTSHLIAAAALWANGDRDRAAERLTRIVAATEPEGILRPFIDIGAPLLAILEGSALRERYPALVAILIEGVDRRPGSDSLADPLSPRELEVLRLIAGGLSNREIGDRLFIALDTVKGHTRKIYEKLEVSRRTEAVARATEIGLL